MNSGMIQRHGMKAANGFSLLELLVVLVIIGLISAMVIPQFKSDPVQLTTRELYTLLTAARIYALTYRVQTGLAYMQYKQPPEADPDDAGKEYRIDNVLKSVSKNTWLHLNSLEAVSMIYLAPATSIKPNTLVPLWDQEGYFRKFQPETCIANFDPELKNLPDSSKLDPEKWLKTMGSLGLSLCDIYYPEAAQPDVKLYCHLFNSDGQLISGNSTERISIYVMPVAEAQVNKRFGKAGVFDDASMNIYDQYKSSYPVSRTIQLFRSTGRIKID